MVLFPFFEMHVEVSSSGKLVFEVFQVCILDQIECVSFVIFLYLNICIQFQKLEILHFYCCFSPHFSL